MEQTTSWCCTTHTFVTSSQNTLESQTHLQGLHLSPLFTFICFQTLFFFIFFLFITLLFLSLTLPSSIPSLFPSLRFQPLLLANPLSLPLQLSTLLFFLHSCFLLWWPLLSLQPHLFYLSCVQPLCQVLQKNRIPNKSFSLFGTCHFCYHPSWLLHSTSSFKVNHWSWW